MTTLNSTIQVRRGTAAQMPTVLLVGELYFQTDTSELYAGTGTSVVPVSGGGDVASVFGRTGTVVAEAGDYSSVPSLVLGDGLGDEVVFGPSVGNISITGNSGAGLVVTQTGSGFGATHAFELSDTIASVQSNNGALTVGGNSVILEGAINEAPTPSALDNSTKIATTAYTDAAVAVETSRAEAAEALLAPLASPALTGTPTAPTQTALTNNTDIATTAYTDAAVAVETSRAETAEATKQATLTGTGIARNGGACTELSGDVTTSGSNAASVVKVNGAAVPVSKIAVGTNSNGQLIDIGSQTANYVLAAPNGSSGEPTFRAIVAADVPTLNQNTTGTAANLSGTPALPNGTTATEQAAGSADAKVATDSYVDRAVATETSRAEIAEGLLHR